MNGGNKLIDQIQINLRNKHSQLFSVYIDVFDSSLSRKWLAALNNILKDDLHLEKNYCFFGFADGDRNQQVILDQINTSIDAINKADIGYTINDKFTKENTVYPGEYGFEKSGGKLNHDKFNMLHRYFEDLQGVSGRLSPFYLKADAETKWHIRQLNLLCHEYESLILSMRMKVNAPEWQRPSQLMCWLNAPRFVLSDEDYELFGIETLARPLGGVFVGVNKAVGKHHWEVFQDEGKDSRIHELVTTSLRPQTEAAGDFDIEWANNPGEFPWMKKKLNEFKEWLIANNFDPSDKLLTIGHPQVGQVNLEKSFGTTDYKIIWNVLSDYLDVYSITTSDYSNTYDYRWSDSDFIQRQIDIINRR